MSRSIHHLLQVVFSNLVTLLILILLLWGFLLMSWLASRGQSWSISIAFSEFTLYVCSRLTFKFDSLVANIRVSSMSSYSL